jgi:hypothetical protein
MASLMLITRTGTPFLFLTQLPIINSLMFIFVLLNYEELKPRPHVHCCDVKEKVECVCIKCPGGLVDLLILQLKDEGWLLFWM